MVGIARVSLREELERYGDISGPIVWGGRANAGLASTSVVFINEDERGTIRYCWSASVYYCQNTSRWLVATRLSDVGPVGSEPSWDLCYDETFGLCDYLTAVNGTRWDWTRINRFGWRNQRVLRNLLIRYQSGSCDQDRPALWASLSHEARQRLQETLRACPAIRGPTQFLGFTTEPASHDG